jgi:V8-like Glu-specific endopeptidase
MSQSRMRSGCALALFAATASAGALIVMSVVPEALAVSRARKPGATLLTASPASSPSPSPSPSGAPTAVSVRGTPAVGALFTIKKGKLRHFCTAAVVQSKHADLAITAAHCMQGRRLGPRSRVTFAAAYHDGKFPFGRWIVRSEYVDRNWRLHKDANDDVAFLLIGQPGHQIQKQTGGEKLKTNVPLPQTVQVIGYPDSAELPVTCTGPARRLHLAGYRQMVFDCGGYSDGTSGGPFLIPATKTTPTEVIGVIGGYQQGGNSSSVSYSPLFIGNVAALFKRANS